MGRIFDWVDKRFSLSTPHKNFLQRGVPAGLSYLYCLGGIAFTLVILLVLTGMMLSMYYVPSEAEAFQSVLRITREVRLGALIRGIHKWSANLLILFILLHTLRVFLHKAYRPPRELNWVAGALTLVLTLSSGFTGYLLPWNQKAYWATVVSTNMVSTVPLIGRQLLYLVRGGLEIDGTTLVRFYSLHVLWLPLAMGLMLWAHFHMVKRQGISGGL
ncbi:MAG: cytochrome b N-terminal domain-containing protein [Nitrospiraceae bacterium]|nr:cytochrome b N-terminal domain-containing protein [Nitrospiraceae bacterium]